MGHCKCGQIPNIVTKIIKSFGLQYIELSSQFAILAWISQIPKSIIWTLLMQTKNATLVQQISIAREAPLYARVSYLCTK